MELLIIILILLAVIMSIVGIIGAIVPAIPGPPISFASLLMLHFISPEYVSGTVVWTMLAVTIIASVLDYVAPIWLTKLGGGSKAAMWGSTLGVIAGLFFMPWGLIIGPLAGAFFGELNSSNNMGKATKVAFMSFVAFLLTTGIKLVASLVMSYYIYTAIAHRIIDFADHVILPFS